MIFRHKYSSIIIEENTGKITLLSTFILLIIVSKISFLVI